LLLPLTLQLKVLGVEERNDPLRDSAFLRQVIRLLETGDGKHRPVEFGGGIIGGGIERNRRAFHRIRFAQLGFVKPVSKERLQAWGRVLHANGLRFVAYSAVTSGVREIKLTVAEARERMKIDGNLKKAVPTPVKGAIHTSEFNEAAALLADYLGQNERSIHVPTRPVQCTSSPEAEVYGHKIRDLIDGLERHVCDSIYFHQSMERLGKRSSHFTVIGPGAESIGKIIARIVKDVFVHPIDTIKNIKNFYDSLKKPKTKDFA